MNRKRADKKGRPAKRERLEILTWVKELTDKQLVEFFYEVVQGRKIFGENEDYFRKHLVLAIATSSRDWLDSTTEIKEFSSWSPWELYTLGLAEHECYGEDANICEHGDCCNHHVTSWAKNAICPVCGDKVHLT